MHTDDIKARSDAGLQHLVDGLNTGQSQAFLDYLAALGRFHQYSFGNTLLIHLQRPDATHVAGFHAWRAFGRFVRAGEKGIAILAPLVYRRAAAGSPVDDTEDASVRGFRVAYVFDIAQTDGAALPPRPQASGDPAAYLPLLKEHISARGIELTVSSQLGSTLGVSYGGRIVLSAGLTPAEEFVTLVHELTHELLHHTADPRPPKLVGETEAEAVAFVVAHAIGLSDLHASTDYIQHYRGDAATVAASLGRIQATAHSILAAVFPAVGH